MSDWSQIFIGRERELGILKAAYAEAALGQTRVVSVIAESGFGKTRLVQQFYNWLSTHHNSTTGRGYWPDSLARNDDTLTINPLAEECGVGSGQMPFLWWGLRLFDPLARNGIIGGSLWAGVDALKPHLALLEKELQKSAITSRRNKVLASGAIDLSMEAAANIFTFGLMGVGKTFAEKGKELYDIQMESRALDDLGTDPTAARKQARDKLTATILTDLHRIAKAPPKGISPVPVVVVIDDVQWIHQDTGLMDFTTSLVQRGRAENWPLLIIMTSWEKEWRESLRNSTSPAMLCDEQKGDHALHLLPAPNLDEIIPHVFPGLTDEQKSAIVEQVDGNPRFLNELLQFLLRNRRYFEGRDQSGPLTARGMEEVTAMSFPDFVGDRFADAPENVRKALSLASTHGIIFAPRLVDLMSEHLGVADSSAGLLASEDPYGFATLSSETELGEFRIRAYRNVAADELENFFDRDEIDEAVSFSHTTVIGNITSAKDVELKHILSTASDPAAIEAAIELVHRANQIGDPRTAGEISTSVLERLGDVIEHGDLTALTLLLKASWLWNGPGETSVAMLGRVVDLLKTRAVPDPEGLRVPLTRTLELLAQGTLAVHGPKTALPMLEACAELNRQLAGEQGSVEARRNYAWSLAMLGDVVEDLQGPGAVEPLRRVNVTLCRDLAAETETATSLDDYAHSLTRLGNTIGELEGQDEALSFHDEAIAVFRKIDEMAETSASLLNLANALAQYSVAVESIEGDASALPWLEEAVALFEALAKDQGTPAVRRHLADSLGRLGAVVKRLEGSAAARPLRHREVALCLSLFEEMDLPGDRFRLACSLASLAEVVRELDGPTLALDIQEEAISQLRATLAGLETPEVKMNLALECANLAEILEELGRETAAQSAREEALALFETIHHHSILTMRRRLHLTLKVNAAAIPVLEHDVAACRKQVKLLDSLEARSDLADALNRLGRAVEGSGQAGASRVIREEEVATRRVLVDTLGTPEAHYAFARALARYGKLILHFDGPVEAETIFWEEVSISYYLVDEEGSVRARRQLINALVHYDGIFQKILPYRALTENEIVNRKFSREEIVNQERAIAHEEQTPEADQRVAGALRDYAEIVRQCDGLAAARSVREEVVALSRSRASSERDHGSLGVLADDIAALACLIEQIEGVASAVSLMDEEVDIRRKITLRAPFADSAQLALSLSRLGQSVRQLRGRAPARPYYEEQVSILRERVRHYNSASCKSSLAYGLLDLAELLDMLEGPAAADGLRREVATLHSAIQVENEELDEWNQVDLDVLTDRLASTGQLSLDGDPIM